MAVEINGDQLSALNVLGLILCLGGICSHVLHKYTTLTANTASGGLASDNADNATGVVTYENHKVRDKQVRLNYRTGQAIPLLDEAIAESDTDDSQNENQNSSDIIFDVLKRRDIRR